MNRRTFLRTIGAGSIGATITGLSTGTAAAASVITMEGGGDDIWGTADAFHYYYEEVSGDFDVVVQNTGVEDVESWTKAGPMVRESLDPSSKNVMVRRRHNGEASMQYRPGYGTETQSTGGTEADWLRLKRSGDTVETYHSTENGNWTLVEELSASDISLSDDVYVGIAVTSHLAGTLATATFRNLSGVSPNVAQDVGDVQVQGSTDSETGVALVSTGEAADVGSTSATVSGEVADLGGADSAECYVEYRKVPTADWEQSASTTLTETGSFSVDVSGLTGRRYYQARAVAETSDGTTARGGMTLFSTDNPAAEGRPDGAGPPDHAGPESASQFEPGDGFAEAAPWLDDETPVIKITEPTREMMARVVGIDGERLVVFETSGTIDLGVRDMPIPFDKCYLAGQTAPSPGITLVRGRLHVTANDCVVQHLRVRLGDAGFEEANGDWALDTVNTADGSENNVIDHVSASWSVDECLSVGYDSTDTTVSNCLVAEALDDSIHPKGAHGYGSLIGNNAENVALLGNVWAQNTDRHPRLKEGTESVVVNNVMYNYEDGTWMDPDTEASIEGNAYLEPNSDEANVFAEDGVETAIAHVEDNYTDGDVPMVDDDVTVVDERPLWPDGLEAMPSDDTLDHNLANVGARPADRTPTDERILDGIRDGSTYRIDSQSEVGGYPALEVNTHDLDVSNGATRVWLRAKAREVETTD